MIRWTTASASDRRFVQACGQPDRWLSEAELRHLEGLVVVKRRRDWLLGRWAAKGLVLAYLHASLRAAPHPTDLSIEAGEDGAPRLLHDGPPLSVSISHSHGRALCAIADGGVDVGVDLERIEPRSEAFVDDFFTPSEIAWIHAGSARERDRRATTLWSAKEAALKALRLGLTVDTRSVRCRAGARSRDWSSLHVEAADHSLDGWWRVAGRFALCLVVRGPSGL